MYKYLSQAKLKLQLFTENPEGAAEPNGAGADGGAETPKTFDDVLGNKDYQAEFDRRVTKALDKAKSKWQEEAKSQIETAKTQAEKLATMTEDERAVEAEKQRLAEFEERERLLNQRELKVTAIDILAEKGLSPKLADVLNYQDENTTKQHIDSLETAFNEAVQAEVDKRLANSVDIPTGGSNATPKTHGEKVAEKKNQNNTTKTSLWG